MQTHMPLFMWWTPLGLRGVHKYSLLLGLLLPALSTMQHF